MSRVEAPNCVTVFGGGIAGLTAAHELVERGFRVQVWEPESDPRFPEKGCDVGGMARTQWSRVHWPLTRDVTQVYPLVSPLPWELRRRWEEQWEVFPLDDPRPDLARLRELILNRVPVDDDEARISVEMRYVTDQAGPATTSAANGDTKPEIWQDQPPDKEALLSTRAVLSRCLGARDGNGPWAMVIPRANATPIEVLITAVPEDPWVAEVMRAATEDLRLVFHYSRPWGEESQAIVTLPQKGYLRYLPKDDANRRTQRDSVPPGSSDESLSGTVAEIFARLGITAGGLTRYGEPGLGAAMVELATDIYKNPCIHHVYLEVFSRKKVPDKEWDWNIVGALRALMLEAIREAVKAEGKENSDSTSNIGARFSLDTQGNLHQAFRFPNGRIFVMTAVRLHDPPYEGELQSPLFPDSTRATEDPYYDIVLSVRVREHWLPGEHGYRFFPAFYHHVFDTMRRTPVLDRVAKPSLGQSQERAMHVPADVYKYVESFRVVYDNLKSQKYSAYAFADGRAPELFDRYRVQSLEKRLQMWRAWTRPVGKGGLGLTSQDLMRMGLHALKYVTSSTARRVDYEDITWMEFIQSSTLSLEAQNAIRHFPKSLVAMDAEDGDARTLGSAGFQTMMDQLVGDFGFRDGTLSGPTSEAWFKYWRQYLEAQGVEFIHGKLVKFEARAADPDDWSSREDQGTRPWPVVECYEPRFPFFPAPDSENPPVGQGEPALMPGYFVLALPALEIHRIAVQYMSELGQQFPHRDLERAAQLDLGNPRSCVPDGELRHFSGVQFYFEEDVLWLDGHAYYPDSPWNLTTISQARFWADRHDWEHGYRGVMSVIVGRWDAPGTGNGKTAWECSRDELIAEVWHQVCQGLEDKTKQFGGRLPRPLYWHLDDFMAKVGDQWINSSPFQIETPGNFKRRPGDLDNQGYSVEHGIGLCGTYMKTHTRITTMEAANESGRHLTNAILKDIGSPYRRTLCEIFPIEEREPEDLSFLKEVDERLYEQGLPHVFDIIGVDELLQRTMASDDGTRLDFSQHIRRYQDTVRSWCLRHRPDCIPW